MRLVLALILFSTSACAALNGREPAAAQEQPGYVVITRDPDSPFAKVLKPAGGAPRVVGEYSRGCFGGGMAMPQAGEGFAMVNIDRNRFYGHPALIDLLMRAGSTLGQQFPLLIGDLSQPRGGPMPYGHTSHQSGLDADIWFSPVPYGRLSIGAIEKNYSSPTVLKFKDAQGTTDLRNIDPSLWKPHYIEQLKWFAQQPEVARIFVNAVIKRDLCSKFPNEIWLTKLRPWSGHDDHYHVRLNCPPDQPECIPQPEIVEGIACEPKDFEHWLSPTTIEKLRKDHEGTGEKIQPKPLNLPIACKDIVESPPPQQ